MNTLFSLTCKMKIVFHFLSSEITQKCIWKSEFVQNVFSSREELKAFHFHVTELEENRDKIELDIEREKQAENR